MNTRAVVDQLTPTFGQEKARNIVSVASAINALIAESPISQLEDHLLLPGLAAVFGAALGHARALKMERRMKIAEAVPGVTIWPSLCEPDEVLEIVKLTDVEPEENISDEYIRRLLRAALQDQDDKAFEDLDAEVRG